MQRLRIPMIENPKCQGSTEIWLELDGGLFIEDFGDLDLGPYAPPKTSSATVDT